MNEARADPASGRRPGPGGGAASFGLALGAGGLRGFAHVGVLRALLEAGLRPAALAGSSVGAVVAALYAAGWTPQEMEALGRSLDGRRLYDPVDPFRLAAALLRALLSWLGLPQGWLPPYPLGLIQGRRLQRQLERWIGERRFEELKIPLAVVATDLTRGQRVVFSTGARARLLAEAVERARQGPEVTVPEAVRASTAIPVLFAPVRLGDRFLVDGGVLDAVPVDVVRAMGVEVAVGVDLGFADRRRRPLRNAIEVGLQSLDLMGDALTRLTVDRYATLVIRPEVRDVSLVDFREAPELVARGYEAGRAALPALRRALEEASPGRPTARPAPPASR
ncbi:MAG: patatin-like phospholipase family protein [Bacillota bacterium]|nr:patatin-like phospholipase family protein [Bacillota bacterium]